jgi:DNA segregation ATPase FtsK/SpoIIIE-like protein
MPEPEPFWSMTFDSASFDDLDISSPIFSTEYDLLDRVIELVVQSGAYSRPGLAAALQLAERKSMRMTFHLETLGVIGSGDLDGPRRVLVPIEELSMFLGELRANRRELADAYAA